MAQPKPFLRAEKREAKIHYDLLFDDTLLQHARSELAGWIRDGVDPAGKLKEMAVGMLQYVRSGEIQKLLRHSAEQQAVFLAVAIHSIRTRPDRTMHQWGENDLGQALLQTIAALNLNDSVAQATLHAQLYYNAARWVLEGRHIFEIAPGLAERLRHTELRALQTEDLQLPYPSLYLIVPDSADLYVHNESTGVHRLRGVYVTEDTAGDPRRLYLVTIGEWTIMDSGIPDDAVAHLSLWLRPGRTLDECLADVVQENRGSEHMRRMGEEWPRLVHWVMNVLLYSTSSEVRLTPEYMDPQARRLRDRVNRAPKGSQKQKKAQQELNRVDSRRKIVVGANIARLSPQERGVLGSRRLMARFLRMGHWRQQACGPRRSERRRTWIAPHWVGPASSEEVASPHVIK
jgi:hypothetical protein